MKANEAPEKIYFSSQQQWTNPFIGLTQRCADTDIEYIRTDAFIEKAAKWLSDVSIEDMTYKYNNFDTSEGWYKFIEDFRKAMEG